MTPPAEPNEALIESPETSPNRTLTERQRTAIGLLVTGKTHAAVAEELGVNRRTIWEWKQDPTFAAALNSEREAIREAMQDRVLALADKALAALERTLEQGDSDSARVAAARLVLDRLLPTCHAEEGRTAGPTRVTVLSESDIRRLSDMQRESERARRNETAAATQAELMPRENVLTREEAIEILRARHQQARLRG